MKTKKLVMTALLAALACVATMVIKVPSPKGYVNLGDSVVLLAGWMMSPLYGFYSASIGSMLADLLLGYGMYAPATFVIKGVMAVVACLIARSISKKTGNLVSKIISGVVAEVIMISGYFLFEGIYYGSFYTGAIGIPFNAVQGIFGLVVGIVLARIFEKSGIMK